MPTKSEANGQNSELDPKDRRSGAHIEKMLNDRDKKKTSLINETVRPSESYTPPGDTAEGDRHQVADVHRRSPEDRQR
jgi:hypothetical protein